MRPWQSIGGAEEGEGAVGAWRPQGRYGSCWWMRRSYAPVTTSQVTPYPPSTLLVPRGDAACGAAVHLLDGVMAEVLAGPVPLTVAQSKVLSSISWIGQL